MPVDLTPGGSVAAMRESLIALKIERDDLVSQLEVLPGLYDELYARDETIARLEGRGITEMQVVNEAYRLALQRIVDSNGRGGLKIAAEALES